MDRIGFLVLALVLALPASSLAGLNPQAKLAMHLVASDSYLTCAELAPASCDSINVDLSAAEILASGGYGYVAFVAYDVTSLTGAEFAVTGWPTGRGAPALNGPVWCSQDALTLGDHLGSGGITTFPAVEADENGIVLLGHASFGPLDEGDFPITLEYSPSSFTYPGDPHNYVLDGSVNYEEDGIVTETGCTVGGSHAEGVNCGEDFDAGSGIAGVLPQVSSETMAAFRQASPAW